jgi:glycosyltransferase involved in cell wall biosynthesis
MYRLLLIKRTMEDIFIFPFVLLGKIIARLRPLKKEYRIYFFFPFYHTGGAEKIHSQIAHATGGNDCIIFFTRKSVDERFLASFRNSGCECKDISSFTDNKWFYFLNLIYRGILSTYINQQQHTQPMVFNGQCNLGYKISPWLKKDIPQVELLHSLNSFSYIRIPFLPFITHTVMISKKRIEDHRALYKRFKIPDALLEKISYIPNAIPLPAVVDDKPAAPLMVLFAGRDSAEKRIHLFLKTATLFKDNNEIAFAIMGDVSRSVNPSGYPNILFHGGLSDPQQISRVYQQAHLLLFTSSSEGFPLVIMEAMAYGCIVAATPVGDIPFHIQNGENGFLFSTVDNEEQIVNEATAIINRLKNHPEERKKISAAGIRYANDNFGIDRFNQDYRQLFERIKKQNP